MARVKMMMAGLFAMILAFGLTTAVPSEAQQTQSGLVNVQIGDIETGDILSDNNVVVGAALQVAANVCGVGVQIGVLAEQLARTGQARCENEQDGRFVQLTR
jgi:hypothetical protein